MKREKILKKIEEADGEWRPTKDLVFTKKGADEGGFIAMVNLGNEESVGFWCMNHHEDMTGSIPHNGTKGFSTLENAIPIARGAQILAGFLDIKLEGNTAVTVDKIVERESDKSAETKLLGMVEAYEKILIGREFTAK